VFSAMMGVMGLFSEGMRDVRAMARYTMTGQYVADTTLQARLFGDVPRIEDAFRRWLVALNMLEDSRASR
jgi:hypothetical protein